MKTSKDLTILGGFRLLEENIELIGLFVNCSGLNKKLTSGEDHHCPLHFYIKSDENSFLKVVKVPKTKGISFDKFDEIIGRFQFGVGIG